jgi:dTDP-glucose 4,6-dehydratase
LIEFVEDRPGHDFCYAVDAGKIKNDLGWQSSTLLDAGIQKTVSWYLENQIWWKPLRESKYAGERLGSLRESKLAQ